MPSVLIVESHYLVAAEIRRVLTAAGYAVVGFAPNYNKAVILASARPPELAVIDYALDHVNAGIAVADYLRRFGTKILYLTTTYEGAVALSDAGAVALAKPFEDNELLRAMERVLSAAAPSSLH